MPNSPSLPSDLFSLVKPRITMLLTLTGLGGMLAAGGAGLGVGLGFLVAVACMAGGSAALNCWYDRQLDARMSRTRDRPLPAGRLPAWSGLAVGLGLVTLSSFVSLAALPLRCLVYLHLGLLAYIALYTVWLKRRHWLGVVLGGSAGSFPVLAGWGVVEPPGASAWIMAGLVFAWTPPHAWALAHVYRDDFASADIPTLPVVWRGEQLHATVFVSALATAGTGLALIPFTDFLYPATVLVTAPLYLWAYGLYYHDRSRAAAVTAFFTANLYLACLFLAWGAGGLLPSTLEGHLWYGALLFPLLFFRMWKKRPSLGPVEALNGPSVRDLMNLIVDHLRR